MISKHMKGGSFSRCLHYVIGKAGARVIGGNLLSAEPEAANAELQAISQRSQRTQKPLLHCALSLAPGEHLSEGQWRQLARSYLAEMGLGRNQYLLVRHTDTPSHEHVHLIVNRVTFAGVSVSNSWDFMQAQVVVRQLAAQYGLAPVPLSWEKRASELPKAVSLETSLQTRLSLPPVLQVQQTWEGDLRVAVNGALLLSADLSALMQHLSERQIQAQLLKRRGRVAGIAFEWRGQRIAGSRLGRAHSLPKLLSALAATTVQRPEAPEQIANAEQFEPEPVLSAAHQRYRELEAFFQRQANQSLSRKQIDLKIAQWALRSSRPAEARALVYSPDIQQLSREQGEQAARDYLRPLLESTQQRLREVDREKHAQMEQKRNERRGQLER